VAIRPEITEQGAKRGIDLFKLRKKVRNSLPASTNLAKSIDRQLALVWPMKALSGRSPLSFAAYRGSNGDKQSKGLWRPAMAHCSRADAYCSSTT
jgi:hypothetical protein